MNVIATTPRATRYDLQTPVTYRGEGDEDWHEGQGVNVSRTGVLFQVRGTPLERDSPIAFVLELRAGLRRPARVECRGRVARCCVQTGMLAIAATIDTYRFVDAWER